MDTTNVSVSMPIYFKVQRYLLSMKNVKERLGTPNENQLFRYARERIPGIFVIVNCKYAREKRTRNSYTNSLIIDDVPLIDFPGDSYLHLLQYDLCFANFNSFTNLSLAFRSFYGEDLAYRMSGYALDVPNRLTVYGNEAVKTFYQRL